jgi:hypothetical protein
MRRFTPRLAIAKTNPPRRLPLTHWNVVVSYMLILFPACLGVDSFGNWGHSIDRHCGCCSTIEETGEASRELLRDGSPTVANCFQKPAGI